MSELVKVAVDAMGGDNAPGEIVKGAVMAVNEKDNVKVLLFGKEDAIKKELEQYTYDKDRVEVIPCEEVIEMAEAPVNAIRKKKDSSIVKGMQMTKSGEADAFVSVPMIIFLLNLIIFLYKKSVPQNMRNAFLCIQF